MTQNSFDCAGAPRSLLRNSRRIALLLLSLLLLNGCVTSTAPQYRQNIVEVTPVPGLTVRITYLQTVFWAVGVRNDTEKPVRLIWDESAYITSTGISSRLIRSSTRIIDSANEQPASPVPPRATYNEAFTAERFVEYARYDITPQPTDPNATARMYLVFDVDGQRVGWEGEVSFQLVQ